MPVAPRALEPPTYLLEVAAHLRATEPRLWEQIADGAARAEQESKVRLELLKATVRLDAQTHGRLYEAAARVREVLGLSSPVTFYQSTDRDGANAALLDLAGEAHVVLSGSVLTTLTDPELTALVAHELSHAQLWTLEGGSLRTAAVLVRAMAEMPGAPAPHARTHNLYRQFCEAFADRGALLATGDLEAVIRCLVKTETGLSEVSASAYLQQADEILRAGVVGEGVTHPETFIRAKALELWAREDAEADALLLRWLEGPRSLETLDLLAQRDWERHTRELVNLMLAEPFMQTDALLAHARLFFPDFAASPRTAELARAVSSAAASLRDYVCYVLLDFALVDPTLEDVPLAQAFSVAESLGLADLLAQLAVSRGGLTKKRVAACRARVAELKARAKAS